MNYILVMTMSGNCMLLLYFIQKYTWGKYLSKQWQYFFLKAVMVYYMLPIPYIGSVYREAIRYIFPSPPSGYFHYYHDEKVLFRVGNSYVLNSGYQHRLLVIGVWFLIPFLILGIQLIRYGKACKEMKRCGSFDKKAENMAVLEKLKEKRRVKRKVALCLYDRENTAFTVGTITPVIVCSLPEDTVEKEMLLEHELVHIKRMDIVWKIMGTYVKILHCFNPFVYLFLNEFGRICEESCDEEVVKEREEKECRKYALMLVNHSASRKQAAGWRMAMSEKKLTKSGERILERTKMIMNSKSRKNKWSSFVSVLVIGAMVILNSLTALAYEEVKIAPLNLEEELKEDMVIDIDIFPDDGRGRGTETVLYNEQFIDEEGNIYCINEDRKNTDAICKHAYISGKYQGHVKNTNGGCTVTQHEGQYCNACGECISGDIIWILSNEECPHS